MNDRRKFCRRLLGITTAFAAGAWADVASPQAAAECRIQLAEPCQRIDGFGASGAFRQAGILRRYPPHERARMLDLLFSPTQGAGLSWVRNLIGDGGAWGSRRNGPTPSIEPSAGAWNWQGDDDQIWLMRAAARRGCTRFFSSAWSPPAWMKTNQNVIGGELRRDAYAAYAKYLARYVEGYRRHHGLVIAALSPQNEPDVHVHYSSCHWTAEQYHTFMRDALQPTFQRARIQTRLVLGEHSTWSEAVVRPTLEDATTAAGVDVVASHAYAGNNHAPKIPLTDRTGRFALALRLSKPVWQTEVSAFNANDPSMADGLYWAKLVHYHLAEDQVSGWFYWWLASPGLNREALILLDPASGGWLANKRLFTLGQYSRFLQPGAIRLAATRNPAPGVLTSAWRMAGANGRLAVVAINENPAPVRLRFRLLPKASAATGAIAAWRTSFMEEIQPLPPVEAAQKNTEGWMAELRPISITTFVSGN